MQVDVLEHADEEKVLAQLVEEVHVLGAPDRTHNTTLLVLVNDHWRGFHDYLALHELVEAVLEEQGLEHICQVATFHPQYRFRSTKKEAPENYTNRSPYPMLHLLRTEDVSAYRAEYCHHDEGAGNPCHR
jgi:hypothetical protein